MKTRLTTYGKHQLPVFIDVGDYEKIKGYNWCISKKTRKNIVYYYVQAKHNGETLLLHRLILDAKEGELVDHRDHDGLNNTRDNLRLSTPSQNRINSRKHTVGAKGVSWDGHSSSWRVQIEKDGCVLYRKRFKTLEEAKQSYLENGRKLLGPFFCEG